MEAEQGSRERGSELIIHPCPLADRSRHAALWASTPAYREEEKKGGVRENSGGMVGGGEGREEINACQANNLREVLAEEPRR